MVKEFIIRKSIIAHTATMLCVLLLFNKGLCQNIFEKNNQKYWGQIRLWISPVSFNGLKLKNQGENLLHSSRTFSGETGIGLFIKLKSQIGIHIGAGIGLLPWQFDYNFKPPQNSVFSQYNDLDLDDAEYEITYFQFPLSIQYTYAQKRNYSFFLEPGIKLNSLVNYPYWIRIGSNYHPDSLREYRLFEITLNDAGRKNLISYSLKTGIFRTTKNLSNISLSAVMQFCPLSAGQGNYQFSNLPFESRGSVSLGLNYLGLEFSYGIALKKKKDV